MNFKKLWRRLDAVDRVIFLRVNAQLLEHYDVDIAGQAVKRMRYLLTSGKITINEFSMLYRYIVCHTVVTGETLEDYVGRCA